MTGNEETTDGPRGRAVFHIHVMKTGGSNLVFHLAEEYRPEQIFPGASDLVFQDGKLVVEHHLAISSLLALSPERRRQVRVYSGHYPFVATELLEEDLTTVTVLRDPIARTVSLLRASGRPGVWADRSKKFPMMSWPLERVYEDPNIFEPLIHNHQTKVFSMTADDPLHMFRDVIEIDDRRLALAKANLAKVDIVGINERYGELLEDVRERLGWRVAPGGRVNTGPPDDERPLSESLRRRIEADNAIDMEFYEYATRLSATRHSADR